MRLFLLLLFLVLFVGGCIEPTPSTDNGLKIDVEANPSPVFSGSTTNVYVDVENTDTKTLKDVNIRLYYLGVLNVLDTGSMSALTLSGCYANGGTCSGSPCPAGMTIGECRDVPSLKYCCGSHCSVTKQELKPDDLMILSCALKAPSRDDMVSSRVSTEVGIGVRFTTTLSAVQLIEMITENEYGIKVNKGEWKTKPRSYTYRDKNIEMDVEFSDELPIIVRPDKKAYVYFTIKNIGGGYISDITGGSLNDVDHDISYSLDGGPLSSAGRGDFSIQQKKVNDKFIVTCDNITKLPSKDNIFPRIACELNLPNNINYLSNYMITINLNYNYEKRKDLPITVIR